MFKQVLFTQWRWSAWLVLGAAIAGFAIPVTSVEFIPVTPSRYEVSALMNNMQSWGYMYPTLAWAVGLSMALSAWAADHQGRHVYALSLPLPRWHYVLLRFGAGALLILPAVAGVWIGGLVASVSVTLPPGLHAYPTSIALRFALGTLFIFSLVFAIGSGSKRTATWFIGSFAGLFLLHALIRTVYDRFDLVDWVLGRLVAWPGPLEVFVSAWMLINV